MKMKNLVLTAVLAAFLPAGDSFSQETAFGQLLQSAGNTDSVEIQTPVPNLIPEESEIIYAQQWIPPNNDEPGFEWTSDLHDRTKSLFIEHFISIGDFSTFLKIRDAPSTELTDKTEKCNLNPNTKYTTLDMPGFYGDHMIAMLAEPPVGCTFNKGYVYMEHVSSSSAGGVWQLPKNVRAFLDTIAYAEGTNNTYNFIFTFQTFKSYADHPRKVKCRSRLCSSAAGRYQFLANTWDVLAKDLSLPDFTPPNQDKAAMELIRRAGAYKYVSNSSNYDSFVKALNKLNTIWASLPGSPYEQTTHSISSLWKFYKQALSKYN